MALVSPCAQGDPTDTNPSTAMPTYTATIPGQPIGKGRPRIGRIGRIAGHARAYTPEKTARWEDAAALALRTAMGQPMLTGPLRLDVVAVFARPQRMMGKKWPNRRELHTVKPDKDNVEKIVADALQKAGVVRDDCTICDGETSKRYADKTEAPGVWVSVTVLTAVAP